MVHQFVIAAGVENTAQARGHLPAQSLPQQVGELHTHCHEAGQTMHAAHEIVTKREVGVAYEVWNEPEAA